MKRNPLVAESLIVTAGALVGTIFFTWPLSQRMSTHLVELGDSRLNAYIQTWGTHALITNPLHLFDPNFYYPTQNALSGSENLIGNQLLFAPAYLISRNPILATNVVILGSFFLCALTMYLLVRMISGEPLAAAIAGVVYGFALPRVAQMNHMQLLSIQWIPLVILFLYLFLLHKKLRTLIAFSAFLTLQILCSLYTGYLAILVTVCYFVGVVVLRRDLITKLVVVELALATVAIALIISPIGLHYQRWQKSALLTPPVLKEWSTAGSADPLSSYLEVNGFPHHIYKRLLSRYNSSDLGWEKQLFIGFIPMILALVTMFSGSWREQGQSAPRQVHPRLITLTSLTSPFVLGSFLTTVCAYILSLGPYLHIHDQPSRVVLPFKLLQKLVPGMASFRVPARFGFAVLFGVAVLAGFGFTRLVENDFARNRSAVRALLVSGVLLGISLEFRGTPLDLSPVMGPKEVTPEYQWLKLQPHGFVILELPINGPPDQADPFEEAGYVYASVYHWQPLMNGYTGNPPQAFQETLHLARKLPDPSAINGLRRYGLRYLIVHFDHMSPAESSQWRGQSLPGLREAVRFSDETVVYSINSSD